MPETTLSGYLAPVVLPHVYKHLPVHYHRAMHALVQPWTMDDVAEYAGYSLPYLRSRIVPDICDRLHVSKSQGSDRYRVELTRLYCGADRCWCQR